MGAYTCQFGVVHKRCRCQTPHTIVCDIPEQHGIPAKVAVGEYVVKAKPGGGLPCPSCGKKLLHLEDDWTSYICDFCGKKFTMKAKND